MNFVEQGFKHSKIILIVLLVITLSGIFFAFKLPVHFFPNIPTSLFVTETTTVGATAKEIDQQITLPFVKKYQTMPKLLALQAVSSVGYSWVDVQFELDSDVNTLIGVGRTRFDLVKHHMPSFASAPIFHRVHISNFPVLWLGLQNPRLSRESLTALTNAQVAPAIEAIAGVNQVEIEGAVVPQVGVYLDPSRMSALGVNVSDIITAFDHQNFELPAGFVHHFDQRYPLNFNLKIKTLEQLRHMVIKQDKGDLIRLNDVASVMLDTSLPNSLVQVNGAPAVGLVVSVLPGASVLALIPKIIKTLRADVLPSLPKGTSITVPHNNASLVGRMLGGLSSAVLYSLILACLIVLIFTQSFRVTWIVITTVPVSLAAAVCALYFLGYSFNIVTLMSFALLIGVAVDDSIVVIENMHKRVDLSSKTPLGVQCVDRTKRISVPVFTTTLTLAVLAFSGFAMSGTIKVMFGAFAAVLVTGVIASYIIAMCAKPYLYTVYMRHHKQSNNVLARTIRQWISTVEHGYYRSLKVAIRFRHYLVLGLIGILVLTFFLGKSIGFSLFPNGVNYRGIDVSYWMSENASYSANLKKLDAIEALIRSSSDVQATYAKAGFEHLANQGSIYVLLKPAEKRDKTATLIMKNLRKKLANVPGIAFEVMGAKPSAHMKQPLNFAIVGATLSGVQKASKKLLVHLKLHKDLGRFVSDFRPDQIQYRLDVNKNIAGTRGITPKQIAELSALFGGEINVGTFLPDDLASLNDNKPIDIKLFPKHGTLINPEDLNKIYLKTPSGSPLILSSIAKFTRVSEPSMIVRVGSKYAIRFWSTPTTSLSNAMNIVRELARPILPQGYQLVSLGSTKASLKSIESTGMGVLMLICIFYIIFAAQFNSLLQPLIILIAQPLAVAGAILGLAIFHMSISLYAMIAIILLIGLVAKNSILIVDRANQMVTEHEDWTEGLFLACKERITPIVMTSLTIMFAMMPVYIAVGQPARGQAILATTIISGVLFSTILSLYIVPVLYYYLHSNKVTRELKD
jgi:hydrophobic/amphiphilic exporter-1 (mainly G- bacteria), HAE1 family